MHREISAASRLAYGKTSNPAVIETDCWELKVGRLGKGYQGYDYIASGRGGMEGIMVLWGVDPEHAGDGRVRRFRIHIGAEVLWRYHAHGGSAYYAAVATLELLLHDLWDVDVPPERVKVRRFDVCIDHWGYSWGRKDLDRFACRQTVRRSEENHDQNPPDEREVKPNTRETVGPTSSTYYVGDRGGSSRMLRVYDKIAEAKQSGKLWWLEPIWRQAGWDGKQTVWRMEVEFGGQWLIDHGFDNLTKLKGAEHALLLDYFADVRHTTGKRSRLKRSPTSRVWTHLRASARRAKKTGEPCSWEWRPRPPSAGSDMEQLEAMAAGCLRKIDGAMFRGDRAALLAFVSEAIDRSAARAARREARRIQPVRGPPLARGAG